MLDLSLIDLITYSRSLVLAVGVIEVLKRIWGYLIHPNISVKDVELVKYYKKEFEGTYVDLKFRVQNNHRLVWFGNYLILMKTMYFIGRGDKGEWHWSGTISGPQNLPCDEKTFQRKNWINEEFPQDTYRIYLIVFSEKKVVFKHSFKVPLKEIPKE